MAVTSATPALQTNWSTAISADNHGPLVTISTCLMLVAMFFFLGFRLVVRWPWSKLLGYDDLITSLGSFVALGASIAIFIAVHNGLGRRRRDIPEENIAALAKAILAGDMLSIVALTCSKLSISLLILRLASFKRHILAARLISAAICIWGIIALSALAVVAPSRELRRAGWIGVGTYSILLEVALSALPVFLAWGLQMRMSQKVTVIAGFAFRIPASILALFRILAVVKMLSKEGDQPDVGIDLAWEYVPPTIFTICEMHYSLMASTIPCMHLFLKHFETGYLGTTAEQIEPSATRSKGYGSQSGSYGLSSVRSRHMRLADGGKPGTGYGQNRSAQRTASLLRREGGISSWEIHPNRVGDQISNYSDGSDKIIVQQTVDVKFEDCSRRK